MIVLYNWLHLPLFYFRPIENRQIQNKDEYMYSIGYIGTGKIHNRVKQKISLAERAI